MLKKKINPQDLDTLLSIMSHRTYHYQLMNQAKQKGEVHRYKTLYETYHNTSNIKLRDPQEASARGPGADRSRSKNASRAGSRMKQSGKHSMSQSPGKGHEQSKRRTPLSPHDKSHSKPGSRAGSRLNQSGLVEIKVEQTDVTEDDQTNPPRLSQIKETEADATLTLQDPEDTEAADGEATKAMVSHDHSCAELSDGEFQACTHEDMKLLANLLKGIKFFSDRNIKNPADLLEVAKTLLLENFDAEEMVFDHGEPGSKFYIILKGAVGVDIPIRIKVEQDELDRRRTLFLTEKLRMVTMIKQLEIELQRKEQRIQKQKNEEEQKLKKIIEHWSASSKDAQIKAKYGRTVEEGVKNTRLRSLVQQAMATKKNTGQDESIQLAELIKQDMDDGLTRDNSQKKCTLAKNMQETASAQAKEKKQAALNAKIFNNLNTKMADEDGVPIALGPAEGLSKGDLQKRDAAQNKFIKQFLSKRHSKLKVASGATLNSQDHSRNGSNLQGRASADKPQSQLSVQRTAKVHRTSVSKKQDLDNLAVPDPAEQMKAKVKAALLEKLKLRMPIGPSNSFDRITSLAPVTGQAHRIQPVAQGPGPGRALALANTVPEGGTQRGFGARKEQEEKAPAELPDGVPETVKEETEDTQRDNTQEPEIIDGTEGMLPDQIITFLETSVEQCQAILSSIVLTELETIWKRVATLKAGDSFGELALIDSKKGVRAARIVCTDETAMGVIVADDYNRCLAKIEKKKRDNTIDFLLSMPYFKSMTRPNIVKLLNSMNNIKYMRGQQIIREGPAGGRVLGKSKHKEKKNGGKDEQVEGCNDDVYFIVSGEFAAVQTLQVEDKGLDDQQKQNQQNRNFLNIQEHMYIKQQQQKYYDPAQLAYGATDTLSKTQHVRPISSSINHKHIIKNPNQNNGVKMSLRANLSNKMNSLTRVSNLTKKKVERQEVELARYGPGKVFGEVPFVIEEFKSYQPCSIKCVSLEAEVLRINGHEFEKKILSHKPVANVFSQAAYENLLNYKFKKIQRFWTIKNFQSMKADLDNPESGNDAESSLQGHRASGSTEDPLKTQPSVHQPLHQKTIEINLNNSMDAGTEHQKSVARDRLYESADRIQHDGSVEDAFGQRRTSGGISHRNNLNQSLDAQQAGDSREASPFAKKAPMKRSRCYDLQTKLMKGNVDKRDAIRQIVEGYPDLRQITNIEFDDGHQAYKNDKGDNKTLRGTLQPKDLTLNQLTPHSLPSAPMASPGQASNGGIHGAEAGSAALRKGQKYLKPLKTTSVGARGTAAPKGSRDAGPPNSPGQQHTQPRLARKSKKLGLSDQQNVLGDSARRGQGNITAVEQQQESSAEQVQESSTSIYRSGKNGRQRTRSKADRVYISSMILDAYEKEKRQKREKIQKIQAEIEGNEPSGAARHQSQVSVTQADDFLSPTGQFGKANSPSVYKGGHFGQLIDLSRLRMPTQPSIEGTGQNAAHLKTNSFHEGSSKHVGSLEGRSSIVNASVMQEQPSTKQYNTITGAQDRQAHASQDSNRLISIMQNDSLNNLQNLSTMSKQVFNRLSPSRQKPPDGVSVGNFLVTPKPQQRFDQNGILVDQFYHHKLERQLNQSLDGPQRLQSNTGTTNSKTKDFLILNTLHPSLNNSTHHFQPANTKLQNNPIYNYNQMNQVLTVPIPENAGESRLTSLLPENPLLNSTMFSLANNRSPNMNIQNQSRKGETMPEIANRTQVDPMEYERGSRLNKMLHLGQNKHSVVAPSTHKKRLNIEKTEGMRIKTSPAVPRKKNGKNLQNVRKDAEFASVTGTAAPRNREYAYVSANKDSTVDGYSPADHDMAMTPNAAPSSKKQSRNSKAASRTTHTMQKRKTDRASAVRESFDGANSKVCSTRKGHGWFTGFMPGAPIKFTNATKNRPRAAKDKHLNLVSAHALYTENSETDLARSVAVTQSVQNRAGRGGDIQGQCFNLNSSVQTTQGRVQLIDRLHTQQNQNQREVDRTAALYENTTTEEMPEGVSQHTKSIEQNPYDLNLQYATDGGDQTGQNTSAAFVESAADAPKEQFTSIQTGPQIMLGDAHSSSYQLPQVVRSDSPVFRDELSNTMPLSNLNSSTFQGGLSPRRVVVPAHGQSNAPFMIRQQKLQQAQEFINQLQSADMNNKHRPIPWRQNGGGSVTQNLALPLNNHVSRQTALKKSFATGGSYSQRRYIPVARTLIGALRSSNK